MTRLENPPQANPASTDVGSGLRKMANILRIVFILTLLAVVVRVSLPQSETIWSAYETPNDLIRLALGIAVSVWLVIQLFRGPADPSGYRTWLYLGPAAIPFGILCLVWIW